MLSTKADRPKDLIRIKMIENANTLMDKVRELERFAVLFHKGDGSQNDLKSSLRSTRNTYKKNEFLFEYYYPNFIKASINGAPLYHLNPYTPKAKVEEPKGLQRLDELVYSEQAKGESERILLLTKKLVEDYENLHRDFVKHPILDREVFEASRLEVIRIFSLGVTGFDTPGSLNGLDEVVWSLESLKETLEPYGEYVKKSELGLVSELNNLFNQARTYLKTSPGFEQFDRLYFLKEYVNPIYRLILEMQLAVNLETPDEVSSLKKSINYNVKNIFDEDFLNPYFYSKLTADKDNDRLRRLGKRLFFDKKLSRDAYFSCASCHNPELGFTDGVDRHTSFDGKDKLARNTPTLLNSSYTTRFFADMRAFKFEDQIEHVIISHKEFNTNYEAIFDYLKSDEGYLKEFQEAFSSKGNDAIINKSTLSSAFASYLIGLKSFNSSFDRYVRGEIDTIDPLVKKGFNIFMGKAACGTCHFAPTFAGLVPPLFNDSESEVLGLLAEENAMKSTIDNDLGRYNNHHPKERVWIYKNSFKTPTIRNASITGPYFHNGAYSSLESVVDFYDHGGGAGLGLDVKNQTLAADSLHLSINEKHALIAFMKSLTDNPHR